jgi:light-regulated signal transduction histidine kinase (bacteriophytochrome)
MTSSNAPIQNDREHPHARLLEAAQDRVKDLEQQLELRTREAKDALEELESFSYSVSHDLRAPLRAIHGFSRILNEDYHKFLDAEASGLLESIQRNAEQMFQLINDLLAYSRLLRQRFEPQAVEVGDLVRQAWEDLGSICQGRSVNLQVAPLPRVKGDHAMLQQAWLNLLSNALKSTARRELAKIEVGTLSQPGERVFFVQDNGVGFDMKYADKLFGVFQRLHSQEDFPGSGIGLAVVKRIVLRHGGRVWAEARPGQGATFYFALPDLPLNSECPVPART